MLAGLHERQVVCIIYNYSALEIKSLKVSQHEHESHLDKSSKSAELYDLNLHKKKQIDSSCHST